MFSRDFMRVARKASWQGFRIPFFWVWFIISLRYSLVSLEVRWDLPSLNRFECVGVKFLKIGEIPGLGF